MTKTCRSLAAHYVRRTDQEQAPGRDPARLLRFRSMTATPAPIVALLLSRRCPCSDRHRSLGSVRAVVLPRTVTRRLQAGAYLFSEYWKSGRASQEPSFRGRRRTLPRGSMVRSRSSVCLAVWAVGLIVGFGGFHWSAGSQASHDERHRGFADDLYMSGTTFFTLASATSIDWAHRKTFSLWRKED